MAYTYNPYEYESAIGQRPKYDPYEGSWHKNWRWTEETGPEWDIKSTEDKRSQFQDYAGEQFKGLFDMANINPNPLQGFAQTPTYSPYSGTRGDFTTGGYITDHGPNEYRVPEQFDQKGYLDARFGNINNYLSGLSSFLGNMSGDSGAAVKQAEIQRANYAANLPQAGSLGNMGGVPQVGGLSGFAQTTPGSNYGGWGGRQVSGGWGSHPVAGGLLGFGGE